MLAGTRTSQFSNWALLVAILPAMGLLILVAGLRQGRRRIHLLAHGDDEVPPEE
mgnify:CR=1 FL=1